MSTTATLDETSVTLTPGEVTAVPLQIRNDTEIVQGYRLEVIGPLGGWARVEPETVSLYPGSSATATVTFSPPRSPAVPSGEVRFGVKVVPSERPEDTVVPEGSVEVLPFTETTAELVPRTSSGSRQGRHRIAVDNRGNLPVTVGVRAWGQTDRTHLRVTPAVLTVPPGQAAFADLRVRPDRRIWFGQPVTSPFTVAVLPPDAPEVVLDGSYVQGATIPAWAPKAVLGALGVLAALTALWFVVLKGAVESAAQEAVAQPVAEAVEKAEEAQAAAEQANAAAGSATGAAADAVGSANQARGLVGAPTLPAIDAPVSERLQVSGRLGREDSRTYEVPDGATLGLTDLVLSNPQGDFGRVRILIGDRVLLESALENFRDLDYHWVTPIRAAGGEKLTMTVQCNAVGAPPDAEPPSTCDTSLYFGGVLSQPAPPAEPAP